MKKRCKQNQTASIFHGNDGNIFVSVTSAMRLVKFLTDEPDDYFGPLAHVHAIEGTGAHSVCLDWLAAKFGFLPEWSIPECPAAHPDSKRWEEVMERTLLSFKEFVETYQVDPIGIEQEDFSSAYGLFGHIDLVAYFSIPGRRRVNGPIDLKFTSAVLESHFLQTRCYSKLDGMKGSQLGGIFNCNRDTGAWKFIPVDLTKNLADVAAVSYAAKLWAWNSQRKI